MKNILHTIETRGPGGAEILLLNIADNLQQRKPRYRNFGFFIKQGWILDSFEKNNYPTRYCSNRFGLDPFLLFSLYRFVKQNRINVIHAHEFYMSFYSALLAFFTKTRVVCTFHGMKYHSENARRRRMLRFIAAQTSLVTVSEKVKETICSSTGIGSEKVSVIENGINMPDLSGKGRLKEELQLPSDSILVGSVGRLHAIKGHIYLLQAAEKLTAEDPRLYFVIAGEGAEREALTIFIQDHGLENRVHLLGTRQDIENIFLSLDIFVLPSLSEGTSLALLEAMSCNLPIIATRVGNNPKLIRDGENGYLVNPQDPAAIERRVARLLPRIQTGKTFFIENRSLVEKKYAMERMMEQYRELYQSTR